MFIASSRFAFLLTHSSIATNTTCASCRAWSSRSSLAPWFPCRHWRRHIWIVRRSRCHQEPWKVVEATVAAVILPAEIGEIYGSAIKNLIVVHLRLVAVALVEKVHLARTDECVDVLDTIVSLEPGRPSQCTRGDALLQ
ncbi:hypothetical protein GGR52DRAFT_430414 [Hypoxylon sp. FL1284]|nr:hypothetical protein GGR52DRAFT_430414 [Hypoxylon sp. FL1284]